MLVTKNWTFFKTFYQHNKIYKMNLDKFSDKDKKEFLETFNYNEENINWEDVEKILPEYDNDVLSEGTVEILHDFIQLDSLYKDVQYSILLNLEYQDVLNFCQTKNLLICHDKTFWVMYMYKKYGFSLSEPHKYSTKELRGSLYIVSKYHLVKQSMRGEKYPEYIYILLDIFVSTLIMKNNVINLRFMKNSYKFENIELYLTPLHWETIGIETSLELNPLNTVLFQFHKIYHQYIQYFIDKMIQVTDNDEYYEILLSFINDITPIMIEQEETTLVDRPMYIITAYITSIIYMIVSDEQYTDNIENINFFHEYKELEPYIVLYDKIFERYEL